MRSPSSFFLLFLLFLFVNLSEARKDPEDYWKSVMKGEAMPKAIEELVHGDPAESLSKEEEKKWEKASETINMAHFRKDFDTGSTTIIYHRQTGINKKMKPLVDEHETDDSKGQKSFAKHEIKP